MEVKKTYKIFRFQNDVFWKSGRRGTISSPGKPDIEVSSPPEFKGEVGIWTPEDMFVASVNVCTLMTFAAFAQHKGLGLVSYECAGEGVLEYVEGRYRFTEVILHPHVVVKTPQDIEPARKILEDAHRGCLITNSTTAEVKLFPDVRAA